MVEVANMDTSLLLSKHEAIATLFRYAIRLEQGGKREMFDAILRVAGTFGPGSFESHRIWTPVRTVFGRSSPPSLNRAIISMAPYVPWPLWNGDTNRVSRWAAAALAVPYSEEVCQNIVDTLLWVSHSDPLRSHIPVDVWAWLKRRPSLPPVCMGRSGGSRLSVVRYVRGLKDPDILDSYLHIALSEWAPLRTDGHTEMESSIREDFVGIGMWCYRDGLIKHLDHVQGQLDLGLEHFKRHKPQTSEEDNQERKRRYAHLKNILLDVDKRAMETLTRTPLRFTHFD